MSWPQNPGRPKTSRNRVEPLLLELHELVAHDSISAIDKLEQMAPLLRDTQHAERLETVAKAIDNYDFDEGMVALTELAGDMAVTLPEQ